MGRPRVPLEQRFWAKVRKGKEDECWMWQAYTDKDGYGTIGSEFDGIRNYSLRAHRIALELAGRSAPSENALACHHCDNPGCVNPRHLYWGTVKENVEDRNDSNPSFNRGKDHPGAKLTDADVKKLRHLYHDKNWTGSELANNYGVSEGQVRNIVMGRSWTHIRLSEKHRAKIESAEKERSKSREHRLTPMQVSEIKKLIASCTKTHADIARQYGVSQTAIYRIATGKSWVSA